MLVYLCFAYTEGWTLAAVFDNEPQAEAWLTGIIAGYAQGRVVPFDSNGGAFTMPMKERDR